MSAAPTPAPLPDGIVPPEPDADALLDKWEWRARTDKERAMRNAKRRERIKEAQARHDAEQDMLRDWSSL